MGAGADVGAPLVAYALQMQQKQVPPMMSFMVTASRLPWMDNPNTEVPKNKADLLIRLYYRAGGSGKDSGKDSTSTAGVVSTSTIAAATGAGASVNVGGASVAGMVMLEDRASTSATVNESLLLNRTHKQSATTGAAPTVSTAVNDPTLQELGSTEIIIDFTNARFKTYLTIPSTLAPLSSDDQLVIKAFDAETMSTDPQLIGESACSFEK